MAFDESKTFYVTKGFVDLEALAKDTAYFLEKHKKIENVQYFRIDGGYLIQAKDPIFSLKGLISLNKAVQFQLILDNDRLTVKFSTGEWVKHMVGSGIGIIVKDLVFAPLTIPSMIGVVSQLKIISDIYKYIETYVTNPSSVMDFLKNSINKAEDNGFILRVEDVFTITGRGIVTAGKVETGSVRVNDEIYIVKPSGEMKNCCVTEIELFNKNVQTAVKGDNVGLSLSLTIKREVERGDIICTLEAIETSKRFIVGIYPLTKKQGGRDMPLFEDTIYQFDMSLGNSIIDGQIRMLDSDNGMVMWGEGTYSVVELSEPCTIYQGMEFNIIENGKVRAHGIVDENLDKEDAGTDSQVTVSFYADIKVHDEGSLDDPLLEGIYTFNFDSQIVEGSIEFPADRKSVLLHGVEDVAIVKLKKPVNISKGAEFSILEENVKKATGVVSDFTDK